MSKNFLQKQSQNEEQKQQVDRNEEFFQEMINQYQQLLNYKNNLFKLDALITLEQDQDQEEDEEQRQELLKMRGDLLQAIAIQEDNIKTTFRHEDFIFSTELLLNDHAGRLALIYHKVDNRWYHGQINNVNVENQEADVNFIGDKDIFNCSSIFIKIIPPPAHPEYFESGSYCEAIYNGDGQFYPCIIEKVSEDKKEFHIKFQKYNDQQVVSIYFLREPKKFSKGGQTQLKKRTFDDLKELKIPEYLKSLPNDSEAQRKSKKKKIKALKAAFKQAVIEKDSNDKKSKWQNFHDLAKTKKQLKGKINESIFRTNSNVDGKVGVIGSGKGMTGFQQRSKHSSGFNNDNGYN